MPPVDLVVAMVTVHPSLISSDIFRLPARFFALVQLIPGLQPHPNQQHAQNDGDKNQVEFVFDEENDTQNGRTDPKGDHGGHPLGPQGLAGSGPLRPWIQISLGRLERFPAAGADLRSRRQLVSAIGAGCREGYSCFTHG